jgi:hypothetical protein
MYAEIKNIFFCNWWFTNLLSGSDEILTYCAPKICSPIHVDKDTGQPDNRDILYIWLTQNADLTASFSHLPRNPGSLRCLNTVLLWGLRVDSPVEGCCKTSEWVKVGVGPCLWNLSGRGGEGGGGRCGGGDKTNRFISGHSWPPPFCH